MGSPRIPQLSTPSMYCDPALAGLKISSRKITDDAVSRGSVWAYPRRMRHTYMPVRATLIYRSAETPNYFPAAATPNDECGNALFDIMDSMLHICCSSTVNRQPQQQHTPPNTAASLVMKELQCSVSIKRGDRQCMLTVNAMLEVKHKPAPKRCDRRATLGLMEAAPPTGSALGPCSVVALVLGLTGLLRPEAPLRGLFLPL